MIIHCFSHTGQEMVELIPLEEKLLVLLVISV